MQGGSLEYFAWSKDVQDQDGSEVDGCSTADDTQEVPEKDKFELLKRIHKEWQMKIMLQQEIMLK